jgi:alkanesulfonate monooxygenase SsuD/methylene tetrahydromethanopterin reductase-like flavin-dependent oxidoreductase (luciferase family)
MKLGLFMMPLHDPNRDYTKILQDDREAILLAEKLGYEEAWVGEHYSAATEPITDPLQFMATLIPVTKSIKFGTSVLNLPQHHPAQVAGNCAMFDHLCKGRFVMGIGPGGLGSDFELFKVTDKDRSEMMVESIEIIHKIWASDPPYHIRGKYWDITIDSSYQPRLGIGPMRKPYQKPYPPVAVSAMSPSSPSARLAGERGWGLVSANFMPVGHAKTHWQQYCAGADAARRRPERAQWRLARTILVTETDQDARDYLGDDRSAGTTPISATISPTTNCSRYSSRASRSPTSQSPYRSASSGWYCRAAQIGYWTSSSHSSTRSGISAHSCLRTRTGTSRSCISARWCCSPRRSCPSSASISRREIRRRSKRA